MIPPALGWVVWMLFFLKDGFSIKITHKGLYAIKLKNQTKLSKKEKKKLLFVSKDMCLPFKINK